MSIIKKKNSIISIQTITLRTDFILHSFPAWTSNKVKIGQLNVSMKETCVNGDMVLKWIWSKVHDHLFCQSSIFETITVAI